MCSHGAHQRLFSNTLDVGSEHDEFVVDDYIRSGCAEVGCGSFAFTAAAQCLNLDGDREVLFFYLTHCQPLPIQHGSP